MSKNTTVNKTYYSYLHLKSGAVCPRSWDASISKLAKKSKLTTRPGTQVLVGVLSTTPTMHC